MNRRLSERQIRATYRELCAGEGRPSGRALCKALRARFGAVGKTERVFEIWRQEAEQRERLPEVAELERRLAAAEARAAESLARAERAEYREQAHQDKWAMEVDGLRSQLRAQPNYAAEIRTLQERVLKLSVELQAARVVLQRESGRTP